MNIQAMMKQAQKLQNDMMNAKNEINQTSYSGKSSFVEVEITGNHVVKQVKINKDNITQSEVEMLEDLVMIAMNDALTKIEKDTEAKMSKFTNGMPGLF